MPLRSVPASASSRATIVPLTESFSTMFALLGGDDADGRRRLADWRAQLRRRRSRRCGNAGRARWRQAARPHRNASSGLLRHHVTLSKRWIADRLSGRALGLVGRSMPSTVARRATSSFSSGMPCEGRSLSAMPCAIAISDGHRTSRSTAGSISPRSIAPAEIAARSSPAPPACSRRQVSPIDSLRMDSAMISANSGAAFLVHVPRYAPSRLRRCRRRQTVALHERAEELWRPRAIGLADRLDDRFLGGK